MYTSIKKEWMQARKERNTLKTNILTCVISEVDARAKKDLREVTDEDCVAVLKKMIKNVTELKTAGASVIGLNVRQKIADAEQEIEIMESFLPSQMTGSDLTFAVQRIIQKDKLSGPQAMGQIMAALKAAHGGQYDGKLASNIVKEQLQLH